MTISLLSRFEIAFEEDVYVGRLRGAHGEIVMNAGYDAVQVVALAEGRIDRSIPFPNSDDGFAIETWLVAPDGSKSWLFGREPLGYAYEVDHARDAIEVLALPDGFDAPTGLCWFAPGLNMRDHRGRNWALRDGKVAPMGDPALPEAMRTALRLERPTEALGVLRMSHEHGGMYVLNGSSIGFVSTVGAATLLAPHEDRYMDVALYRGELLLCARDSVAHAAEGRAVALLDATEGESFLAIDSVTIAGQSCLLCLSARLDGSGSVLRAYSLN